MPTYATVTTGVYVPAWMVGVLSGLLGREQVKLLMLVVAALLIAQGWLPRATVVSKSV